MKISKSLLVLSVIAGLSAGIQSALGLFCQGGGSPFAFTTLRGETVQIYGQGIYFYDTYFKAPILRGSDALILLVILPLLAVSLYLASRGSLRGKLILTGTLAYLLYYCVSVAFGVSFNNLFLIYTISFAASLFAFILAFTSVDIRDLARRVSDRAPRKGMAVLFFVTALGLSAAWLPEILAALLGAKTPPITSYTTEVTWVFDLGIIVPVSILTGLYLLQRKPMGYLLAGTLLVVEIIIGLMVTIQTIFQISAGITLSTGEFIGKAGSFMLLSLWAAWLTFRLFQCILESNREQKRIPVDVRS